MTEMMFSRKSKDKKRERERSGISHDINYGQLNRLVVEL